MNDEENKIKQSADGVETPSQEATAEGTDSHPEADTAAILLEKLEELKREERNLAGRYEAESKTGEAARRILMVCLLITAASAVILFRSSEMIWANLPAVASIFVLIVIVALLLLLLRGRHRTLLLKLHIAQRDIRDTRQAVESARRDKIAHNGYDQEQGNDEAESNAI